MRRLRIIACAAAAVLLAACSGGARTLIGAGGGTGGSSSVAKVTVSASPATIAVDGSSSSTITATALDANNAAVAGQTVSFGSSTGGVIGAVSGVTSASGVATATLTNSGAAAGSNLTVTAKVGTVSGTATVAVVAIQQSLSLQTSLAQIPSDGSKPATISAILRDANNNALAGATVHFAVTSGVIAVTQPGTTDANGIATATLTAGTDPTNRTITVTATAGSATATVPVGVTGTSLTLAGPSNLVLNNTGNCSAVLTNSAGQGIAGVAIALTSANGNVLSAPSVTTDTTGRANFTVKGTNGGVDTIKATGEGLTQAITVSVSTQSFNITAPVDGTKVNLGTPQIVTVTWLNAGAPVVGQPVTFAATRGTLSPTTPVTTDASGKASVTITSTGAGSSIVEASASGVSAQVTLDFIARSPSQISVQAGPAAVGVQGQSTISALVRDAANNLVEGATVDFQVTTDPTNGSLSVASATTDAQGRAQTVYTAGNSSSGANGVTISATVAGTAIAPVTTNVTVGGQTVFLRMGTGNTIDVSQGTAIYQVLYTVFAVDSHGAPIANVPITMSVLPVAYGKGLMIGCVNGQGTNWFPQYNTATSDTYAYQHTQYCRNEDTDYTGNINSLGLDGSGKPIKDYNTNGVLDPGNVAVVSPSAANTDVNGRLDVKVTYPRDHAYWVWVTLVASTTVQGTESNTMASFVLEGAAADYKCANGPPGPISPYGQGATCADPL